MLKDPNWWMRDVLTALIVAVVVSAGAITGQKLVDDERSDREGAAAAAPGRAVSWVQGVASGAFRRGRCTGAFRKFQAPARFMDLSIT